MTSILDSLRRARAALLIAQITAFGASACVDPSSTSAPLGLDDVCKDSSCPSGTTCRAALFESEELTCSTDAGSLAKDCVISDAPNLKSASLIAGFGVPRLESAVDLEGGIAKLSWQRRDNTAFVHCALFACAPRVELVGSGRAIANYDQCVIAENTFSADEESVFDLSLGDYKRRPPGCGTGKRDDGCPIYAPEILMAACWAYSATRLEAVTDLQPVWPSAIADYNGLFDPACAPGSNGRTCRISGTEQLGTCNAGACAYRCLTPSDCERAVPNDVTRDSDPEPDAAEPLDAGMPPAVPACRFECTQAPNLGIGVCVAAEG